jgi:hypothetical protein
MDEQRFDALTRSLTRAHARRGALVAVLGGALGLLGLAETTAKHKKRKKKHKTTSPPPPSTCIPSCAGKVCGSDGCGGTCGIPCTGGKTCQDGLCVCPGGTRFCPTPELCQSCCANADCAAGAPTCESGTCCTAQGDPCTTSAPCCGASQCRAIPGGGDRCCVEAGESCADGIICCSTICNFAGGFPGQCT